MTSSLSSSQVFDSASASDLGDLKPGFDELGYCVADGLWTSAQVDEIERFFEEYKTGEHFYEAGATSYAVMDKTKQQVRAMHPHRENRRALEWMIHPPVAGVLALFARPPGARGADDVLLQAARVQGTRDAPG